MNAVFTPTRVRITTDRYQKMVAAGVLTKHDRVELIEGEMIDMAPIGPEHVAVTGKLNRLLVLALGNDNKAAIVIPGCPVNLGAFSEPQPDLTVLKPRADFYASKLPEAADVLFLIEVSDSSLVYDQGTKLALYARYGVVEYWIVNIAHRQIEIYREPTTKGYAKKLEFKSGDALSPQAFPDLKVAVSEIFG
jgi:Uma2 family endonuclease